MKKKIKSGVYEIFNPDKNRMYYGSSIDVADRLTTHKLLLRGNKHPNKMLQSAYSKYGESSFVFRKIITCDASDVLFYEQMMMDVFQSYDKRFGYNIRKLAESNAGVPCHENSKTALNRLWQNPDYLKKRLKYKSGDRFGMITLLSKVESKVNGGNIWACKCDCGRKCLIPTRSFLGNTKSCGCIREKNVILNGKSVNISEAERILGLPVGAIPQRRRNYKETHQQAIDFLSKKTYKGRHEKKSA